MKKLLLLFFLLSTSYGTSLLAQSPYFIYFEAQEGKPFYVKMGEQVLTSTISGYLLLTDLGDTTYQLRIGYGVSPAQEAKFVIPVAAVDHGYLISSAGQAIELKDLLTGQTLRSEPEPGRMQQSFETRNDPFTLLLSKASNDPGLIYVPVYSKTEATAVARVVPPPAKDTVTVIAAAPQKETKDTVLATAVVTTTEALGQADSAVRPPMTATSAMDSVETKAAEEPVYMPSVVRRYSESSTTEGFGLVFIDSQGDNRDTIRLLIPNPKRVLQQTDTATAREESLFLEVKKDSLLKLNPADSTVPDNAAAAVTVAVKAVNSSCKKLAGDGDFFRLRRNMAARDSDEGMLAEARKAFRNACFTTEQIRNLGALFLDAEGRYRFFEAARPFVADPAHFQSLREELKEASAQEKFDRLTGM